MTTEQVTHDNRILALIIYHTDISNGVHFFTDDDSSLQVGKHNHPKGKIISPHRHIPVRIDRTASLQEVLYIEHGKVEIIFYTDEGTKIQSKVLNQGDLILLMEGGHGFRFLTETRMIEIKQGPYMPESKKSLETKK